MEKLSQRLKLLTLTDWIALGLFVIYVLIFSWLNIRQFQSFHFGALDLAKFDQGIWSTAQGRPYRITLTDSSVIQSHFSPSLALFAPLYWLWPDIRLLFIAQALLNAGAGALIYLFFRKEKAWLGLAVFAAYLLHPSLHQVNLIGFRRLTIAVFATSFVFYHLLRRNYKWAALGLFVVLLSKEDMAFTAIAVGLYVLIIQRSRKWGLAFLSLGLLWLFVIPFAVLPALNAANGSYSHADAKFPYLGDTLPEIVQTLRENPTLPLDYVLKVNRVTAVWRFFWPTLFIFLLAPEVAFFLLPYLAFYMASVSDVLGELRAWYPSVLLPILYWAVAIGLTRLQKFMPSKWFRLLPLGLVIASFAAWMLHSELWPGVNYQPWRYEVDEHDRQVAERLKQIPDNAIVAAQDGMVVHLSHRDYVYLFPWIDSAIEAEYIILDPELDSTYPLLPAEYRTFFYDVFANTDYELADQLGSLYVFQKSDNVGPNVARQDTWSNLLTLQGYSIAAAPPGEAFQPVGDILPANTQVRITLYWQLEQDTDQNYTVFTHLLAPDGWVIDQHDDWPANRHRATSNMVTGQIVRDVHYLTLPNETASDNLRVRIGIYESLTNKAQFTQDGEPFIVVPLKE